MNKNDLLLLMILVDSECINNFQSKTASALASEAKLSQTKVRAVMNIFLEKGYVKEGFKKANSRTFYITQEGINVFEQATA